MWLDQFWFLNTAAAAAAAAAVAAKAAKSQNSTPKKSDEGDKVTLAMSNDAKITTATSEVELVLV